MGVNDRLKSRVKYRFGGFSRTLVVEVEIREKLSFKKRKGGMIFTRLMSVVTERVTA